MTNSRAGRDNLTAVKQTTETVNNSTTYQDDNELTLTVRPSQIYSGELHILWDSSQVADIKIKFILPSGASGWRTNTAISSLTTTTTLTSGGLTLSGADTDTELYTIVYFTLLTTNAGTFKVQWAQNTAEATVTTVHQGSYLVLRPS